MSTINVGALVADDTVRIGPVPSDAYPDGRYYAIPSLSSEDGKLLTAIAEFYLRADDAAAGDDEGDDEGVTEKVSADAETDVSELVTRFLRDKDGNKVTMQQKLLGDALEEMLTDGVTNNRIQVLTEVVGQQARQGTVSTQEFVNARVAMEAALGEALARPANRATRRAAAKAVKKAAPKPKPNASDSSPKVGSNSHHGSSDAPAPAKKAAATTRGRRTSPNASTSVAKTA